MKSRRKMTWLALLFPVVVGLLLGMLVLSSRRRPKLGVLEGRLRPCPESPNCVCSFDHDSEHQITPLKYSGEASVVWQRLRSLLEADLGVRIVTETPNYLHAEFTTRWLRFVDDVEFLQDVSAQVIHVRSASRVGHSDLGVNRRRIEGLRHALGDE